jgi:hypothetical protein
MHSRTVTTSFTHDAPSPHTSIHTAPTHSRTPVSPEASAWLTTPPNRPYPCPWHGTAHLSSHPHHTRRSQRHAPVDGQRRRLPVGPPAVRIPRFGLPTVRIRRRPRHLRLLARLRPAGKRRTRSGVGVRREGGGAVAYPRAAARLRQSSSYRHKCPTGPRRGPTRAAAGPPALGVPTGPAAAPPCPVSTRVTTACSASSVRAAGPTHPGTPHLLSRPVMPPRQRAACLPGSPHRGRSAW